MIKELINEDYIENYDFCGEIVDINLEKKIFDKCNFINVNFVHGLFSFSLK